MEKAQAQSSIKNIWGEAFSLEPSSLITLFEIDVGPLGFSRGVISQTEIDYEDKTVFRFHNNIKLTTSSIFWNKKEYIAAPIVAEGFEIKGSGPQPTPKLSLTVSDQDITLLSILKSRILQLGDIVGAKVTRIRTFAKFLDTENFFDSISPQGFVPDPNAELPRDIYFIDRKSNENKNLIQFELSSILDMEGIKLPGRLVIANTCPFTYRGNGCMYEYNGRRNTEEHGESYYTILPELAPPVATESDEKIANLLSGVAIVDRGEHNPYLTYNSGETVYVEHNGIKYYFIANGVDIGVSPPNRNYWIADQCSKKVLGCMYRWGINGAAQGSGIVPGNIPYGGYTSVNRFK